MISTFSGVWDEKSGSFSQKVFFRVQPTKFRASRAIFWGKSFLFPKCFFLLSILEFDWFLCLFPKMFNQVCQITDQLAEKKIWGVNLENCFLNHFWTLRKKTCTFSKTVRHDSQNRSLPVQKTIFRKFPGSKTIWRKVFDHWTETSDFGRKCFLRIVKGAFQMSSASLLERDDKSKLYILWLV